ncbi:MAG: serine hydrolase domain-containing protein [Nocardioidaceae bacterium]
MSTVNGSTDRRLRARLARAQVEGRLPAVVAGLVRDGELVWSGSTGDLEGPPLDTQFRIGSITKTLTAVLVLQEVRRGALALDAPVGDVLGDVPYADRSARSLLAHASGLTSESVGEWWERSDGVAWEELVARHRDVPAVFPDRQQFHYSNLAYALLGELAARSIGLSWWDAVRQRITVPLGMTRTTYLPEAPAAQGHSVHPYDGTLADEPATDTRAMAPAGQLWSTITDLATYASFLIEGHPEVLALDDLLLATHPQAGDREFDLAYAHGLGFMVYAAGSGLVVGHTGSMPGFLAGCLVDRGRRMGAVLLSNATTGLAPDDVAIELMDLLERDEPTIPRPWLPTASVPEVLLGVPGVWHWGNTPFTFAMNGDELVVSRREVEKHRFVARDGRIIGTSGYHAGEELHVVRDESGAVDHLVCATFVYTKRPYGH